MNAEPAMLRSQRAFTLIEILVAVLVLAIMAVAAYGGLDSLIKVREATQTQTRQFHQLQLAMAIMTRDLEQAAARPIRRAAGDLAPAMSGGTTDTPPLVFTRFGVPNPLLAKRSGLERVAYEVNDGKLVRLFYPTLDRSLETPPERQVLLPDVNGIALRFLDESHQWQDDWPPLNAERGKYLRQNPIAVEITLDTQHWGTIKRLIGVAP